MDGRAGNPVFVRLPSAARAETFLAKSGVIPGLGPERGLAPRHWGRVPVPARHLSAMAPITCCRSAVCFESQSTVSEAVKRRVDVTSPEL